jgi:hypothetical protein
VLVAAAKLLAVKVGTLTWPACLVFGRLLTDPARLLHFVNVPATSALAEVEFFAN